MTQPVTSGKSMGWIQIGVILLVSATAALHLYLSWVVFSLGMSGVLFLLNGLGYFGLLAALFVPIPVAVRFRRVSRFTLMFFTLVTIAAWVAIGERNIIGYLNKVNELALLIFLWLDRSRND